MYSYPRGSGVYSNLSLLDGKKHDSHLNDNNNLRILNTFNSSNNNNNFNSSESNTCPWRKLQLPVLLRKEQKQKEITI